MIAVLSSKRHEWGPSKIYKNREYSAKILYSFLELTRIAYDPDPQFAAID